MSRAQFLLVLLVIAVAQARPSKTYNATYKIKMHSACENEWKNASIGYNQDLPMCGSDTGDMLASFSSVFVSLNITDKSPDDELINKTLIPPRVDTFLRKNRGYKSGDDINWNTVSKLAVMQQTDNADYTFDSLIDSLTHGEAVLAKYYDFGNHKTDGYWGLVESVTCKTTTYSSGSTERDCSFCIRLRHRDASELLACTDEANSAVHNPYKFWYEAYTVSPLKKEVIALF